VEAKLDAIKQAWEEHKEMMIVESFARNYLSQIDWLIKQAEKVEKVKGIIFCEGDIDENMFEELEEVLNS
jgi:hypothetical protein